MKPSPLLFSCKLRHRLGHRCLHIHRTFFEDFGKHRAHTSANHVLHTLRTTTVEGDEHGRRGLATLCDLLCRGKRLFLLWQQPSYRINKVPQNIVFQSSVPLFTEPQLPIWAAQTPPSSALKHHNFLRNGRKRVGSRRIRSHQIIQPNCIRFLLSKRSEKSLLLGY